MTTSTNYTGLHYVKESTPGTTPTNPGFQTLPTKSGAPMSGLTTAVSAVIRRDRQTDDLIIVDANISGSIGYELSYGPYKPLLTALLQNGAVVAVDINSTAISVTGSSGGTTTYSSGSVNFVTGNIKVGSNQKIGGFANTINNGVFRVTAVTTNSFSVDTTGITTVTESAGANVTIKGKMIRNGNSTPDSFTFLRTIEGVANTAYMYYRGCQVGSMSFNFATGKILEGNFDIVGLEETVGTTAVSGQSITDVAAYALMNSVSSVGKMSISGLPASTLFESMNITINNNINSAKAISKLGAAALASFTLDVTADTKVYFEDLTAYLAFKNSTAFSVSILLLDADGNRLVMTLPKCKFETLAVPTDGKDSFLMLNGNIRGLRDPVTNCMVQFDFLDAA